SLSLSDFSNTFLSANISSAIDLSEINFFLKNDAISDLSGVIRTSFITGGTINGFRNIDLKTIAGMNPRANIWLSSVSFRKGDLSLSDITGNLMLADHLWADSLNLSINDQRILADGEIRNFTRWIEGAADIVEINGSLSSPEFCTDMLFSNRARNVTSDSSEFDLPKGYKAALDIRAGEFRHKKFTAYDLSGEIRYDGGRVVLSDIHARTLGGEVDGSLLLAENASGGYATESNLVFGNIDIYNAFVSFNNFNQNFIRAENLKGTLSGRYDMRMDLDKQFSPDINSISSEGRFTIDNGELINFSPIMSMSKFIEISELENIRFSKLENEFFISSGVFAIPQMEIKSSAADLGINGRHMFSGDYQYHLKVQLSQILSGKAPKKTTSNEFGIIEDDGLGRTSLFLVVSQVAGKSSVKYDSRAARGEVKADLEREKQSLKGILKEELGWYGRDTTVVPAAEQKPTFRIIWDEAIQQDTIKADTIKSTNKGTTVRGFLKKIIKG
ncbi:MAG: hypothetical protein IH591_19500, partial [Bacteroidales bacterium]|nr:hypothetical protein [Bacteroidales bacterium]